MGKQDSLFGEGEFLTQSVVNFARNKMDLYAVGYKEAADLLVDFIAKGQKQDLLVYPAVFLYRHYLELRIKEIIAQGNTLLELSDKHPLGHDLQKLWDKAKIVMRKIWEGAEEPTDFLVVEKMIRDYSSVDPDAQSFRYPEDINGDNKLRELKYIDSPALKARIQKIAGFLDGVSLGISVYLDNQREM